MNAVQNIYMILTSSQRVWSPTPNKAIVGFWCNLKCYGFLFFYQFIQWDKHNITVSSVLSIQKHLLKIIHKHDFWKPDAKTSYQYFINRSKRNKEKGSYEKFHGQKSALFLPWHFRTLNKGYYVTEFHCTSNLACYSFSCHGTTSLPAS